MDFVYIKNCCSINRLLFISYGLQKAKNENIDRGVTAYSDGLRLEDLVKGTDEPTIGTVGSGFVYLFYVCMYFISRHFGSFLLSILS